MLNLSILYLLFTFILLITTIFCSSFSARKIATALVPCVLFLWLFQLFDIFLNQSKLQQGWITFISQILTGSTEQIATFFAGLLIVLELFCIFLMIYAIFSRFITFTPPIMMTRSEKYSAISRTILWKVLLFVGADLSCIFILTVFNHLMQLPEGFLSSFFQLGFGAAL